MLMADRKREGLHLMHQILTNLILPAFARPPDMKSCSPLQRAQAGKELALQLGIKGDLSCLPQALSGGNQQKMALAKWMLHETRVLLLSDQTRGIDVEAKRDIYIMFRQ